MKDGFKKPLAVVLSAMLMSSASLTTLPTFTAMALDDIGTNGILQSDSSADENDNGSGNIFSDGGGTGSFIDSSVPEGNGVTTPYQISNYDQLVWFANQVNNGNTSINAVLTSDILANENVLDENGNLNSSLTSPTEWTPIGRTDDENRKYSGTFDGQGHIISGLYFNKSTDNVGLFGVNAGTIKNVGIADSYFSGRTYVGSVCGYNYSTVENCYSTSFVNGKYNVGGLCGENDYGIIKNSYITGSVNGKDSFGAICGESNNGDNILNCYYLGEEETDEYDGTKAVSSETFASGEIAYLLQENGVEEVWGQRIGTDKTPVLKGEKVYLSSKYSGCAEKYKGDLLSTSYTNDASAEIVYSEHQYDENGICTVCGDVKLVEPEKDINGVYLIADMHNLFWFANEVNNGNVNINAMLASDIVINRDVLDESGNLNSSLTNPIAWTPIGTMTSNYEGVFDGNGHTISGLYFNDANAYNVGLFGYNEGTIKNVGTIDSYFKGYYYVGSICARNYGSGTIESCYNTGSVNALGSAGGLCGYGYGTIINCYNTGLVRSSGLASGLCGYSGTIENSYYLEDCNADGTTFEISTTNLAKSSDAFANGEVAYLLQKGSEIWGQNIGADKAPVLNGEKVFAGYEHGKNDVSYSNTKFVHENPNSDVPHDDSATGDVVRYDKDGHYVECECGAEVEKAHTFGSWKTKDNGKVHYRQCTECGYKESHEAEVEYSFTSHAHKASSCEFYDCDIAGTGYEEHSFTKTYVADSKRHFKECETCGYISSAAHNFENGVCVDCGYEKSLKDAIEISGIDYKVSGGKNRITFSSVRDVPSSYKILEVGAVYCNDGKTVDSSNASVKLSLDSVDGTSIKKGSVSNAQASGSLDMNLADLGYGVYARAYIKAINADGKEVVAYTPVEFEKYEDIVEKTIKENVEFEIINKSTKTEEVNSVVKNKEVFSVMRNVNDGYTPVKYGAIYCNDKDTVEELSKLSDNERNAFLIKEKAGNNIKKGEVNISSNYGVIKTNILNKGYGVYTRMYIVVRDKFNNEVTIYLDSEYTNSNFVS